MNKIIFTMLILLSATVQLPGQETGSYRTKQSGNWTDINTWERYDGVNWVNATVYPLYLDKAISIKSSHTVTVEINIGSVDELLIEGNAKLVINPGVVFVVLNTINVHDLINFGIIEISGTLRLEGELINGNVGKILNNSSSSIEFSNGKLTNLGIWEIQGMGNSTVINVAGTNLIENEFDGVISKLNPGSFIINVPINNEGVMYLGGEIENNSTLNNKETGSINFTTGTNTLNGTGSLKTSGTVNFESDGPVNTNSSVIIEGGVFAGVYNSPLNFTNGGDLTINTPSIIANPINLETGASSHFASTSIDFRMPYTGLAGSTTTIQSSSTLNPVVKLIGIMGRWNIFGNLNTSGPAGSTITLQGSHPLTIEEGGVYNCQGEVENVFSTSVNNKGQMILPYDRRITLTTAGRLENFPTGNFETENGIIGGAGYFFSYGDIDCGAGTLNILLGVTTTLGGGTITGTGPLPLSSATLESPTFNIPVSVESNGACFLNAGSNATFTKNININGTLYLTGNSNINISGTNTQMDINGAINVIGTGNKIAAAGLTQRLNIGNTGGIFTNTGSEAEIDTDFYVSGSLKGNGKIIFKKQGTSLGSFIPGQTPGILTISSLVSPLLTNDTYLYIELENHFLPAGIGYDQLSIIGNIMLNGTLDIEESIYPMPTGSSFVILSATGSVSGNFHTVNHPGGYTVFYNANNVTIAKGVLPVELVDFSLSKQGKKVLLAWQTASEQNASHFEIQRSGDGFAYGTIGQVQAAGYSTIVREYAFLDESPGNGKNFYRLKQVDLDGKFSLSRIVRTDINNSMHVKVFPNPATDLIRVESPGPTRQIEILNMNGKQIKRLVPVSNNQFSIKDLSPGTYLLRIVSDTGIQTVSFIKY